MTLPKSENIETSANPLALIVGESDITVSLSQKLTVGGCEVVELKDFPKSGKFNYIFQFGNVENVKDSHLKFLKRSGKFLFIDFKNENIDSIINLSGIKILRIDNISPWYFQKITDEILKIAFTDNTENIIDIRLNGKKDEKIVTVEKTSKYKFHPLIKKAIVDKLSSVYVQRKISFPLQTIFYSVICLFIFLAVLFYWQVVEIKSAINNTRTHFQSQDLVMLEKDLKIINSKLQMAKSIVGSLVQTPLGNVKSVEKYQRLINAGDKFISSLNLTVNLIGNLNESENTFLAKDFHLSENRFQELNDSLKNLSASAKNLKSKIDSNRIPYIETGNISAFLDSSIIDLDSITSIMPPFKKILYSGRKNYLLLFQNNMELRPTGGFIGSVGFLTLENGKMENLEIMDVYTIDGQLKGHVDPPAEFRKYFAQANFFLRDSNFDPDFAVSSQTAQWFLDKILARKVDGVIGVNLFMVADLLDAIGPVTLTDFNNEVITSKNLFIKAQVFINQNFFAGSSQKKDFLSSVSLAIQKKLTGENTSLIKVLQVFRKSLEEKNLLFNFNDLGIQNEFEQLGWAGRIFNIRCLNTGGNCLPDYLAIIESNFGVNKANYFVSKAVSINKKIDPEGRILTDLEINYQNQSQSDLLQGGDYTNYLRLFVPKGSSLVSSQFNGHKIDLKDFDVSSYQNDKVIFGKLIKISQNSNGLFKFSYLLPTTVNSQSFYQFYYQKQAGDKAANLNLSFESSKYKLEPFNFKGELKDNNILSLSSDNSVDRLFQVKLTP